ncbi:MAG: hypothetical protein K2N36_05735 [Ruminiclostridium sp.]|nr:hypothetical protein [Ruminiclostridium sp.]
MRRYFASCKEEDDSRLTPAEDDDAAGHKTDRKEWLFSVGDQYLTRPAEGA